MAEFLMAGRPKIYKEGTVTSSLTLSGNAAKALQVLAKAQDTTKSQMATTLILAEVKRRKVSKS